MDVLHLFLFCLVCLNNVSVSYNGGLLSDILLSTQALLSYGSMAILYCYSRQYNDDPRLLPSGNTLKYHVEAYWLLQPMKQYITTTRFDGLLHLFLVWFWF